MINPQERYQLKVKARVGNRVERSYSCLCCRDQALIPADVVRRYADPEFDAFLTGDVAYFCRRPGCDANSVTVHTEKGSQEVHRYALDAASHDIHPGKCKQIHELEWQRMREADAAMKSADARPNPITSNVIAAIAKPMPAADPPPIPATAIVEFDQWMDQQELL
jgi:hypothetical protein